MWQLSFDQWDLDTLPNWSPTNDELLDISVQENQGSWYEDEDVMVHSVAEALGNSDGNLNDIDNSKSEDGLVVHADDNEELKDRGKGWKKDKKYFQIS